MIEIPLNARSAQNFNITIDGNVFNCRVILNSRTGVWSIDFSQDGIDLVKGVSLLGGVDQLQQYNLPITNMYIVNLDDTDQDPTKVNLGTGSKVFILTAEEVASGG